MPSERRGSARERGYDARWERARAVFLRAHPLCRLCEQVGRTTVATVVDHIIPHRGDRDLFWDRKNWAPLCATCHNSAKQRQEKSGTLQGCDEAGVPLDPGHQWNAG